MSDGVCGTDSFCIMQFKKCGDVVSRILNSWMILVVILSDQRVSVLRVRNLYQCPLEKDSSTVGGLDS